MTTMIQATAQLPPPPPLGASFLETQVCTSRGPRPWCWWMSRWLTMRDEGPASRWTMDPEADRVSVRCSTAEGGSRGCHQDHHSKMGPQPCANCCEPIHGVQWKDVHAVCTGCLPEQAVFHHIPNKRTLKYTYVTISHQFTVRHHHLQS